MQADTGVAHTLDTAFKASHGFWGALTQPSLRRANRRDSIT